MDDQAALRRISSYIDHTQKLKIIQRESRRCLTSKLHVWYNDFLADTGEGIACFKVMFVGGSLGYGCQKLDGVAHELNATHTNLSIRHKYSIKSSAILTDNNCY